MLGRGGAAPGDPLLSRDKHIGFAPRVLAAAPFQGPVLRPEPGRVHSRR